MKSFSIRSPQWRKIFLQQSPRSHLLTAAVAARNNLALHRLFLVLVLNVFLPRPAFSQWTSIAGLENAFITCFLSTDDTTFFAGGHYGLLVRSTDAGATWQNVWGNGITGDTILTLGRGANHIFAGTYGLNSVSRTSDLGEHWEVANSGLPLNVIANEFEFVDTRVFVATSLGVYVTLDDGGVWTAVDSVGMNSDMSYPGDFAYVRGLAVAGSKLYAVSQNKGVYVSPLDAYDWQLLGAPSPWGTSIVSIDTLVFASLSDGVYMYTGVGTNWEKRNTGLPDYNYESILIASDSLLIIYTGWGYDGAGFYMSEDLGLTWTPVDYDMFTNKVVRSMVATSTEVIAATEGGAWRVPAASLRTVGVGHDSRIPTAFALHQNFPNPFNPATTIAFTLPSKQYVRLTIHDLLGREVARPIDEERTAGTHVVKFEASGLTSGIYYCRLQGAGQWEVRKLVVSK